MQGEYRRSIDTYRFALRVAQPNHVSQGAIDFHARKRGELNQQVAHVQRLWDIQQYAIEYILYREADSMRRAGRFKEAIVAYERCIEEADDTMADLLAAQLSTDFGALSEAQQRLADKKKGRGADKPQPDESPYTAASKYHIGLCLIGMKRYGEAVRHYQSFIASDPGNIEGEPLGLFRGAATFELATLALEYDIDLKTAEKHYADVNAWIARARSENEGYDLTALLPGIAKAAKPLTDGPKDRQVVDAWGNLRNAPIRPGMIVERKTTPWYLDSLEYQTRLKLGMIRAIQGRDDEAKALFASLRELDPLRDDHNSFRGDTPKRLVNAIDNKGPRAENDELTVFAPQRRVAAFLGNFHYDALEWDKSRTIYLRLQQGEFGKLSLEEEAYVVYLLGNIAHMKGDKAAAINYLKVFEDLHYFDTPIYAKALYTYGAIACQYRMDGEQYEETWQRVLPLVVERTPESPHAERALFHFGFACRHTGRPELAMKAYTLYLQRYPNGGFREIVARHLKELGE